MYLMDGGTRIMISEALNESDRLSSCSRPARRVLPLGGPFNVYAFQMIRDNPSEDTDEALTLYNVSGIQMSGAAFYELQHEISLQRHEAQMPQIWENEQMRVHSGLVPLEGGVFHRIIIREGRIPRIDARDFSVRGWTDRSYYEVCTSPAIYEMIQEKQSAKAATNI
jgi:hypothetical protein